MNVIKEIQRINDREIDLAIKPGEGSWHDQYKDSAYIYAGGLPFQLNEGDVICIFSQYGEILDVNMIRDKKTGKSKGFAFIKYEDQRSTILAVDNLGGAKVLGRTLRVDHVQKYKVPKRKSNSDEDTDEEVKELEAVKEKVFAIPGVNAPLESASSDSETDVPMDDVDIDDPMREFILKKRRKEMKSKGKKKKKKKKKEKKEKNKITSISESEHVHVIKVEESKVENVEEVSDKDKDHKISMKIIELKNNEESNRSHRHSSHHPSKLGWYQHRNGSPNRSRDEMEPERKHGEEKRYRRRSGSRSQSRSRSRSRRRRRSRSHSRSASKEKAYRKKRGS